MEPAAAKAEAVFAQALELPRGQARDKFIAEQCAEDAALRQEVESLLEAHEQSGEFLNVGVPGAGSPGPSSPATVAPRSGTVAMDAAANADAFLRWAGETVNPPMEDFIAGLPAALRREVGERIEAGLRVRKLLSRVAGTGFRRDERPPELPGFRIERKLGEGSLGVVYAARDEKLERRVALKVLRPQADGEVRRRVLREARKAAALADPAVVTI
jgi:hypothetical protein